MNLCYKRMQAKHNLLVSTLVIIAVILSPSCVNVGGYSSVEEFKCTNLGAKMQEVPGTPGILISPTQCYDYTFISSKVSQALIIFVEEYSNAFDTPHNDIWRALSGLKIEVSVYGRQVSSAFDVDGKLIYNAYVNGLALSKKHIWIEIKTKQINTTAFIHELAHIVIWNIQGVHGDPDHEGHEYSGWTRTHTTLIESVNIRLLESGI